LLTIAAIAMDYPVSHRPRRLAATQVARLQRFAVARSVDLHCHCLPGIDDGPQSVEDALALCRMLVNDGFTDVIATPHQLGRYDGVNWAKDVRRAVAGLQGLLERERIPLSVYPGAEVRIDERIPRLLHSDHLLTLADAKEFLLLELPLTLAVGVEAVRKLLGEWPTLVLAHAERYTMLQRDPAGAEAWVAANVALQVNASSLLSDAPEDARSAAMYWLEQGWVSLIASDAHSTNTRRPRMSEAIDVLENEFGAEITRRICIDNPARLLSQPSAKATPFD
jgi:protein-tyrosine phosphatase